ncbi:hypothetical protein PoB_002191700 [Plakobranchus ocellatus]|uniref:Uncharacterized protein n=1 Tax=Plakobranchus ocellatus TaxID=259542 RepID=A0AAV3ZLA2_9GAST|nr:hypothetical protein PoB_002191700 [Plakobranchus ocellatus]
MVQILAGTRAITNEGVRAEVFKNIMNTTDRNMLRHPQVLWFKRALLKQSNFNSFHCRCTWVGIVGRLLKREHYTGASPTCCVRWFKFQSCLLLMSSSVQVLPAPVAEITSLLENFSGIKNSQPGQRNIPMRMTKTKQNWPYIAHIATRALQEAPFDVK